MEEEEEKLVQEQLKRNKLLSSDAAVAAALRPFFTAPAIEIIENGAATVPAAAHHSALPAAVRASGCECPSAAAADSSAYIPPFPNTQAVVFPRTEAVLRPSPYPGRRATIAIQPFDRPWDGEPSARDPNAFVTPAALPPAAVSSLAFQNGAADGNVGGGGGEHGEEKKDARDETNHPASASQSAHKLVSRAGGPYAVSKLLYVLGDGVVPFTGLLCSLARSGFEPMTARAALTQHGWALKWIRHPLRSDFGRVRPHAYQKLNHFPGTWRLDKKSTLHATLSQAARRWEKQGTVDESNTSAREEMTKFGEGGLFPEAWVLPAERDACLAVLRAPASRGKLFIAKPAGSSCGRGMYLIAGAADATLDPPPEALGGLANTTPSDSDRKEDAADAASGGQQLNGKRLSASVSVAGGARTGRDNASPLQGEVLVQRYVDDPYLIHGYKFDLRLYVVVTSYAPLRLYLFREGLVRFATTPYYAAQAEKTGERSSHSASAGAITAPSVLTAHLTNFTINKRSEDFAVPGRPSAGTAAAEGTCSNNDSGNDNAWASKWCLSALKQHMLSEGLDWGGTMDAIKDLLVKVFAGAAPLVRAEMYDIFEKEMKPATPAALSAAGNSNVASSEGNGKNTFFPQALCSFKGVSPFFEIYGVDVLLRQPQQRQEEKEAAASAAFSLPARAPPLCPVIMEVNIMPSLSSHYSPLDQAIKTNFIAATLTLAGLSSPLIKTSAKPTALATTNTAAAAAASNLTGKDDETDEKSCVSYGDGFLDALTDVNALETCLAAGEEAARAEPFFDRLAPTNTSFDAYRSLLCFGPDEEEEEGDDSGSSKSGAPLYSKEVREAVAAQAKLDELLSRWEKSKGKA